jgi:cytochrome c-type biogenesis protein CcmH/NrfG
MKKLYIKSGIFMLLLMIGQFAMSQSKEAKIVAATHSYNSLRYKEAIMQLLPIVTKDSANTKAVEMLANSYRLTKQYPEALKWYENLSKKSNLKAEWVLRYAEALATDKEYEKSELWYKGI